ncbi:MAG: lytic transglycosylase domain-containing protein [Peptococcaceae bacterium]|nr:lytic transglycosylase domain-containing protein [Peptococcaceae bacterium]
MTRASRRIVTVAVLLTFGVTVFAWNINGLGRLLFPVAYRSFITRYAGENNLDPRLVAAVIKVESDFRPKAVSRRGALGLMQVMPDTGRWAAGKIGLAEFTPEELYDPPTNIKIGSWYLARLQAMFGRTALALAAYNAGDHKAREWFPGDTSQDSDLKILAAIPYPETRLFVRKVLFIYSVYRRLYDRNLNAR